MSAQQQHFHLTLHSTTLGTLGAGGPEFELRLEVNHDYYST
jgi:hypothetical protein